MRTDQGSHFVSDVSVAVGPAVKAELGTDTATIGFLPSGVTIGAIAGSAGIIGAAMALLGGAVTLRSVPLVTVAFVIIGFGIGSLDVLINVDGSVIERAEGRTLMPRMHGAWSVGTAIGSGIGTACAAAGITP